MRSYAKFRALEFKDNPIGDKRMPWILGLAAAAAAVGAGTWWWTSRHVTVTASVSANSVSVPKGGTLTVNPPAGATWVGQINLSGTSISATPSGGVGTAPLVLSNVQAGGTLAFGWTDSTGVPAGGTIAVTVS